MSDMILRSARGLSSFDANIETLSKLSRGSHELKVELVDLSELVHERVELCRRLYEEDKEARKFIFDIEENINIGGDKEYLEQTLDNIIINSINYCPMGKIIIELKRIEAEVRFAIADEGIGIPPLELYTIFDDFVVSSKTATPAGGRGLGLSVAKRVIEAHGGSIRAESDGVKGSVFIVTLPLAAPQE